MRFSRWFLVVWFAAALVVGTAGAADVLFQFADLVRGPAISRPFTLVSVDTPRVDGAIILGDRISTNTAGGTITISNLSAGFYRGEVRGTWTNTVLVFEIPSTNGLINAANCLRTTAAAVGGLGYTKAQIDALLAALPAGTNSGTLSITISTNGAAVATLGGATITISTNGTTAGTL